MKRIVVLGSTGSIGRSALEIINEYPHLFQVVGLSTNQNIKLLSKQIDRFQPKIIAVTHPQAAKELKSQFTTAPFTICTGLEGLVQVATYPEADLIMNAVVGAAGLIPTLEAIKTGKTIALANKETLVLAGEIVMEEVRKNNVSIIPVDSEHSAIHQCLMNHRKEEVKRLILTASGGPFLNRSIDRFDSISLEEALEHPTWDMGKKITIDSATLINKGMEIIEAHWLFNMDFSQISVVIHPEAIIHSMVEFVDGAILAQLSLPDMRLPIQYALTYPERWVSLVDSCDLTKIGKLTFSAPDLERFPGLKLAFQAIEVGGTMPTVMNAADEVAVSLFLEKKISFSEIPVIIQNCMDAHTAILHPSIEEILATDKWARDYVESQFI